MTTADFIATIASHKWVPIASSLIGLAIRYLKEDVPGVWTVPARWRPWLALALGLAAAVIDRIAAGTSWADALVSGVVAGVGSSASHDLFIEGLRGGKELAVPGSTMLNEREAPTVVPPPPEALPGGVSPEDTKP